MALHIAIVQHIEQGANLSTFVMDVSSLNLGPENYKGIPETPVPPDAMLVTDFNSGTRTAAR